MNEEKCDLKDRLIDFAVRFIRFLESLPGAKTEEHIDSDTAEKMIIEYSALNIESSFLFPLR